MMPVWKYDVLYIFHKHKIVYQDASEDKVVTEEPIYIASLYV